MSDNTKIEWADATVNAVNGCSVTSPGCTNCYAMKQAHRFDARRGLTRKTNGGMVWTGEVRLNESALLQPLQWAKPRRIFWNAHGDLFHESVPDEWIDRVMAVCALTPQHTHMILTKRSERMREYMTFLPDVIEDIATTAGKMMEDGDGAYSTVVQLMDKPLPNVWLGVSVEDQTRADERREDFRNTPAAVKFVSYEPALGYVNWAGWAFVDQIIAGGESGPHARPAHPQWFRDTRDWCAAESIHFFFKQWGEYVPCVTDDEGHGLRCYPDGADCDAFFQETKAPILSAHGREFWRIGKKRAGRLLDGVEHNGVPRASA
ncbi:phage Gp37/Gp68 family protein [Novosphingobium sp.]|uniref:phage Gp37/Gp68 family protein n=1 Tax=Novosphingobium sp. TaxID=1874826 RepID=UPI00261546D1|nr:phage Gp37/Gp68 family protein [Novosphingobium sp.]